MAKYFSIEPSCKQITIKMKACSNKVKTAQLDIALSCIFLREGKATYVPFFVFQILFKFYIKFI